MNRPFSSLHSLNDLFLGKQQQFMSDIDDVHMIWLSEIQQEVKHMFTSGFSAEPELMPKTPSQKKSSRRKRVSLGHQEETRAKRRLSRTKRGKSRRSSFKSLNQIAEDECIQQASTPGEVSEQPKRSTRSNKKTPEVSVEAAAVSDCSAEQVPEEGPEVVDMETPIKVTGTDEPQARFSSTTPSPPKIPAPEVSVKMSFMDRRSAELVADSEVSPGRHAAKTATVASTPNRTERSSMRHSLKLRYSLAGLRHTIRQGTIRRTSRRSILTKSICAGNVSVDSCMETDEDVEQDKELPPVESNEVETEVKQYEATAVVPVQEPVVNERITRSMAVNAPLVVSSPAHTSKLGDISSGSAEKASVRSRRSPSAKRKSLEIQEDSPSKKPSPPKQSQTVVRPNMRSFLQKNRKPMTPMSLGRSTVMKSFIKHTTPLKIDPKDFKNDFVARELLKLEALKKKQEQEEERWKKLEEVKRQKQEEQKRKRDERLRRVVEARMKEDEDKKKRIEKKKTQLEEKNDKMRIAEEKTKKKVAVKRQEEADHKRRLEEEEARLKIQQAEEEEKRQEEEEEQQRARKLAEARRALELRREQEREQEQERERQAAAERERAERQKALAVQRELEKAAREKERRELEERRQLEENRMREERQRMAAEKAARDMEAAKQKMAAALNSVQSSAPKTPVKCAALNVTVEDEVKNYKSESPQSYSITPKGGNKPLIINTNPDDYGMDQNSDDSTDDESVPRKPIPSWAEGHNLQQATMKQYFNPSDLHTYFGPIEPPKLENIFYKSKPRYFKRTSSAVWHNPPVISKH